MSSPNTPDDVLEELRHLKTTLKLMMNPVLSGLQDIFGPGETESRCQSHYEMVVSHLQAENAGIAFVVLAQLIVETIETIQKNKDKIKVEYAQKPM